MPLQFGRPGAACAGLAGFTAHHTVEVGVALPYNSIPNRVELKNAVVADATPVAIVLPRGCGGDDCDAVVEGVYLVGASGNGGCGHDPARPCGSGGTWGGCGKRAGFWASSFDMGPKGFPRRPPAMPYWETHGDAAFGGSVAVTGVTLVNWTSPTDACGNAMAALSTNPTSTDAIVPVVVAGLKRDGNTVAAAAVVHMSNPDPGYVNPTDCSGMDCTGILNTAFVDADGSLLGDASGAGAASMVLPFNPTLMENSPDCSFHGVWNGFICPASAGYDQLAFESLDPDSYTRRVSPVNMTQASLNGLGKGHQNLSPFMDRRWDAGYTSLLRMSRFMAMVRSGPDAGVVDVEFPGTPPRSMRFKLGREGQVLPGAAGANGEGVIIRIRFTSPQTHAITVGSQRMIPRSLGDLKEGDVGGVALGDPAGAAWWQGLTLVHFSAQPEPFLTQITS